MKNKETNSVFYPYLDFYWKFVAFGLVVLIMWVVMNVSFDLTKQTSYWNKTLEDPIFLLLSGIVAFSAIAGSINLYRGKTITIGDDFISLKSRWAKKEISTSDIEYIKIGKERLFYFNEKLPQIKIKLKNKTGHLNIKPDRYKDEVSLIKSLNKLKDRI